MDQKGILIFLFIVWLFMRSKTQRFQDVKPTKEILFVHIPKTAGSMIETQFEKYGFKVGKHAPNTYDNTIKCNFWHIPPKYNKKINFTKYITFAIVRDPLERFISEVNYIASYDPSFTKQYRDINQFVKEKLVEGSKEYDCHLIPQSEYLVDAYGYPVENILRLENLNADLKKFIDKYSLNIKYSNERENQSKKVYGLSDFSEESIHTIKKFYSVDYLFFENPDNRSLFINK